MAGDPDEFLKRVAREASWLRDLVARTAAGLDRLALESPPNAHRLRLAAMWLRRQVHEGPPPLRDERRLGVGSGPQGATDSSSSPTEPR